MTPDSSEREHGRFEAQVETLLASVARIESKLDTSFADLEKRIRRTETDVTRIKTMGGVVSAALSALVVMAERWLGGR